MATGLTHYGNQWGRWKPVGSTLQSIQFGRASAAALGLCLNRQFKLSRPILSRFRNSESVYPEKGVANLFYPSYDYEELINRDKASLDIFWLREESLEESDNLPGPDVLAQEIVEDLEAALEQFREIALDLHGNPDEE